MGYPVTLPAFRLGPTAYSPAFSPDGRFLAALVMNRVCVWDVSTGKEIARLAPKGLKSPEQLCWSSDGRVAVGSWSGVFVMDPATQALTFRIKIPCQWVRHLEFSPDGERLLAAYGATGWTRASIWEVARGTELARREGTASQMLEQGIALADGRWILLFDTYADAQDGGQHGYAEITGDDFSPVARLGLPPGSSRLSCSPARDRLAVHCSGTNSTVRQVWDLSTRKTLLQHESDFPSTTFHAPVWSADGRMIAWRAGPASRPDQVEITASDTLSTLHGIRKPQIGFAFSPSSDLVAVTGERGIVLPVSELAAYYAAEGRAQVEEAELRFRAYVRRIDQRKCAPARAAIFLSDESIVVEAERLVGTFHYLPADEPEVLPGNAAPAAIGQAIRRQLARFSELRDARESFAWGTLGEAAMIRELRRRAGKFPADRLRILGYDRPFVTDAPPGSTYMSVTRFSDEIEIWPGVATDAGFLEDSWPCRLVGTNPSPEEIGSAILESIPKRRASPRKKQSTHQSAT